MWWLFLKITSFVICPHLIMRIFDISEGYHLYYDHYEHMHPILLFKDSMTNLTVSLKCHLHPLYKVISFFFLHWWECVCDHSRMDIFFNTFEVRSTNLFSKVLSINDEISRHHALYHFRWTNDSKPTSYFPIIYYC